VLSGQDGPLDDQAVGSSLLHERPPASRVCGHGRYCGWDAGSLDGPDPLGDEMLADRRLVHLLQDSVNAFGRGVRNLTKNAGGILIARLEAIQVEHCQPAKPAQFNRKRDIHDAIHRSGEDGDSEADGSEEEMDINFLRVDGHTSRHESHLVQAIGSPRSLEPA